MSGSCDISPSDDSSGLTANMERIMFAALMNHLPDRIYFKDMNSRYIAVNEAVAQCHGAKNRGALVGKTAFDLFLEEHAKEITEIDREILDSGQQKVNMEEKEIWPDGRVTYASTSKMPLRDERGRIIGTFGLTRDITEHKASDEKLEKIAEDLRRKNEALEEDLAMARELQLAMLPESFPAFVHAGKEAVHFFHFYQPSTTVSGDFFAVYEMADDKVGIFICDVMGHGVRASLVATTARALVEEMTSKGASPEVLLGDLNKALRRILKRTKSPLFVSACFLVADVSKREIMYANAGHPRPIVIRNGAAASLEGKTGPVLGLFDKAVYTQTVLPYCPGDTLLFFTDGLYEAENSEGELYDYARLLSTVSNHAHLRLQELCREVVENVERFAPHRVFNDDVCLVGMELV